VKGGRRKAEGERKAEGGRRQEKGGGFGVGESL
jgi:hypothetical protein